MKKLYIMILLLVPSVVQGMFTQTSRVGTKTYRQGATTIRRISPIIRPTIQKRTIYKPEQIKGLYSKLTEQAKPVSPAFGAAKYESGTLKTMYSVESDAPAIKLVKKLFYQRESGEPIKPTVLKSNPAYSLNPSILGLVMGALEAHQLADPTVRKYIIEQWKAEHKNVTNGDKISMKSINDLLTIIEMEYKTDKNNACSILLGFLYAKANPDSNHDMLHYLESLNHYIPVFAENKAIEPYAAKPSKESKETTSASLLDKFKAMAQSLKDYFYKPEHYVALQTTLRSKTSSTEAIEYAKERFEESIGAIIKASQESSLYPPQVVMTRYEYQGKKARVNCVEAAIQDLFNILLYNSQSQSFDLSLLPAKVYPDNVLIQFYILQKDISSINSHAVGQAFMNMVSNVPGVIYSQDNYELKAVEAEHNLVTLANHLLGIQVTDLQGLGGALSDERRTVTFTVLPLAQENSKKIAVNIKNNENQEQLNADFCFYPGHGWLEVPARNKKTASFLLEPVALAKEYHLSQQAQALLSLQSVASVLEWIGHQMPASFYYTINAYNNSIKKSIIKHIVEYSKNDSEAVDYAFTLFKQLPPSRKLDFFGNILASGLQKTNKNFENIYKIIKPETEEEKNTVIKAIIDYDANNTEAVDYAYTLYPDLSQTVKVSLLIKILEAGLQKKNKNFENIYQAVQPETEEEKDRIFRAILLWDTTNKEAVDYAYSFFDQFSSNLKHRGLKVIMISGVWKSNALFSDFITKNILSAVEAAIHVGVFNLDTIKMLYDRVSNAEKKKRFLTIVLNAVDSTSDFTDIEISDETLIHITKELVSLGCDINASSKMKYTINFTPIFFAIDIGRIPLIETLIEYGAQIREPIISEAFVRSDNKLSTLTPLHFAIMKYKPKMIEILLQHGVDINAKNSSDPNNSVTPLIMAVLSHNKNMVNLLLHNGADPNISGVLDGNTVNPLLASVHDLELGRNEIIMELLKHGVNVNAVDSQGNTALDIALEQKIQYQWNTNDSYETVEILQKAGAHSNKEHK
jgi:hypothetical protein